MFLLQFNDVISIRLQVAKLEIGKKIKPITQYNDFTTLLKFLDAIP